MGPPELCPSCFASRLPRAAAVRRAGPCWCLCAWLSGSPQPCPAVGGFCRRLPPPWVPFISETLFLGNRFLVPFPLQVLAAGVGARACWYHDLRRQASKVGVFLSPGAGQLHLGGTGQLGVLCGPQALWLSQGMDALWGEVEWFPREGTPFFLCMLAGSSALGRQWVLERGVGQPRGPLLVPLRLSCRVEPSGSEARLQAPPPSGVSPLFAHCKAGCGKAGADAGTNPPEAGHCQLSQAGHSSGCGYRGGRGSQWAPSVPPGGDPAGTTLLSCPMAHIAPCSGPQSPRQLRRGHGSHGGARGG